MIQATACAGTFVRVFEERALRAQYLLRARLTRTWRGGNVMRASETSPILCGHKDALHLNKRNPFQEKKRRQQL